MTIVHAQRASASGDTQVWGLLGCQKEAAFAADRVIVVVEEVVPDEVIRADPNRTIIPGLIVDAVVAEPWGAHPSYVQGAYDRDNRFYLDWDPISRDEAATQAWLRRVGPRRRRPGGVPGEAGRRAGRVAPAVGAGAVRRSRLRGVPVSESLMILVAGPYRSGTGGDPARIQANVDAMTRTALELLPARPPAGDGGVVRAAAHRGGRGRPATKPTRLRAAIVPSRIAERTGRSRRLRRVCLTDRRQPSEGADLGMRRDGHGATRLGKARSSAEPCDCDVAA